MIKISFIVPVYNLGANDYLTECLTSLIQINIPDMEVWMIDDGSTDSSGSICDDFAAKDSRFHVLHQENAGVSAARNAGIMMAKGEWLFFLDGDDLVPKELGNILRFHDFENADMVFFSYEKIDGKCHSMRATGNRSEKHRVELAESTVDHLPDMILGDIVKDEPALAGVSLNSVWGKVYRRGFLEQHGIRFEKGLFRAEDLLFNLQFALCKPKCMRIYETAYYYRLREGSTTDRYWENVKQNSWNAIGFARELLNNSGCREKYNEGMDIMTLSAFLSCVIFDFCHPDNPDSFWVRRKAFMSLRAEKEYDDVFRRANIGRLKKFGSRSRISAVLCKMRAFITLSLYLKLVRIGRYFVEKRH